MRGGQISIEYILIVGFSFLLLIPLIIMFYTQTDDLRNELTEAQAFTAGEALAESAERVYYAGPPTRETVRVNVPGSVGTFTVYNRSIVLHVVSPSKYDVYIPSNAPLVPVVLDPVGGPQNYRVEATIAGVVISEE